MILLADGRPGTRVKETLSREEIALVTAFERWCTQRGLHMDLLCDHCYDENLNPRCAGNNDPASTSFVIACEHADRIYGNGIVR